MPAGPEFNRKAKAPSSSEIPPELVLQALDAVASSPAFGKSPRPARFLRFLVETALRKETHLLKESVLGTDVFKRPATWDPRLDPVVRQEAARLRKRLANYYENNGAGCEVRIELPVGTYVPVFRRQTAPVEELPPKDQEIPGVRVRRRPVWHYALGVMVCLVAAAIGWRVAALRDTTPSIAVLPFTDLTADPSTQYFADGLTDEITDSLARLKNVRVIARSSTFQFKGKTVDIHEVGRLLHVANVAEGTVERSGDRVRIIAHLERVEDGTLIWSNTFESGNSDLFALQSELAAGIASGLKTASTVPSPKHVPIPEAHDYVLKARYDLQQLTPDSLAKAETEYRRAIETDPQYAAAYLGLGTAEYDRVVARGSAQQTEDERRDADKWIHKSLELDPDLSAAHAMLAALAMQYDWDWGRAERELQAAAAGTPSVTTESYYAMFLVFHGHFAEAEQHIQRTLDLDPYSTVTMNNISLVRTLEGRFADAREIAQRFAVQFPNALPPQQILGMTYIEDGHPDKALPIFHAMEPRFPQIRMFEAVAQAAGGHREEALRLTRPYEENWANSAVSMQWFAIVYAYLGDEANTVKWLQRSADRHEWQVLNLAVNPFFAHMQNAPGIRALKKRLGL